MQDEGLELDPPHALLDVTSERAHPQPSGADRRSEPRYTLSEPAVVEIASWGELVELYTKDISCGGMFVQTDTPPARDTHVAVRLRLPDGAGTLELEGVVVHVVSGAQARTAGWTAGFGLQFAALPPERRRALQRLVEQAKRAATQATVTPNMWELGATCVLGDDGSLRLTVSEAEHRRLEALRAEYAVLLDRDDHEVLELEGPADPHTLRLAFERVARRWHPDAVEREAPPEIHRLFGDIHARVEEAYQQLSELAGAAEPLIAIEPSVTLELEPEPEPSYAPPVSAPRPVSAPIPVVRPVSASASAARPSVEQLAERSEQITSRLKRRVPSTASSSRPEHRELVDDALRLVAAKRYPEAIARLEIALQRTSEPRVRVLLSVVQARQAIAERDFPRARARYEAVLELDPDNEVAKRELLMLSALMTGSVS